MKNLRNYVSASIGLGLFVSVIGLSLPQSGHGTPAASLALDVRVVNSTNQAVPVAVQGTPTVNATQQGAWNVGISGTPTVNATQQGPWNVGISGTPTVNSTQQGAWNVGIAGTPTVQVGNAAANPVLTRDVDRPTAQPYVVEHEVHLSAQSGNSGTTTNVPAGKLFVIEQVSVSGYTSIGEKLDLYLEVATVPDVSAKKYRLVLMRDEGDPNNFFVPSQQLRIYARGQYTMVIGHRSDAANLAEADANFVISGYLVDE